MTVRFGDDVVIRGFGNCAARCYRGQPRAAASAQTAIDAIVMEKRAASSARRGNTVGEHVDDFVKIFAFEIAIRIRRAGQVVQVVRMPFFRGARGNDLLRENIERRTWNLQRVHRSGSDAANERRAFE